MLLRGELLVLLVVLVRVLRVVEVQELSLPCGGGSRGRVISNRRPSWALAEELDVVGGLGSTGA